jgi:hypothetical protein
MSEAGMSSGFDTYGFMMKLKQRLDEMGDEQRVCDASYRVVFLLGK